jgi:hypothetical protein
LPVLELPASEDKPLVQLLYVLKHADDICLDGPTARSITGQPRLAGLIHVINTAVKAGYAVRTGAKELTETDRDFVFGIRLTAEGRRLLERVLHLDEPQSPAAR